MTRIVGVRFKKAGKIYDFNACDFELPKGTSVIVETENGLILGIVAREPQTIEGGDNGDGCEKDRDAVDASGSSLQAEKGAGAETGADDKVLPQSESRSESEAEEAADKSPDDRPTDNAAEDEPGLKADADESENSFRESSEDEEEDDDEDDAEDDNDDYDDLEDSADISSGRSNNKGKKHDRDREDKKRVLKKVIRVADDQDFQTLTANRRREDSAFQFALTRIESRNLPIKLIDVEYLFDRSKAIFTFTADGRVDFRSLVKDLAAKLHTRIEMKQVRVRDEAKIVGGLGSCGRELCCSTFLNEFAPVSVRMAKEQSLALNPAKVSGLCGRLMCCLTYEHSLYHEMGKGMPKLGKNIETPRGRGRIIELNILQRRFRVALENGNVVTYTPDLLEEEKALDKKGKLDLTVTPDQKLQQLEPSSQNDENDKDAEFEQIAEMLPTSELQLREERARKEKERERNDRNKSRGRRGKRKPPRDRVPAQGGSGPEQQSAPTQGEETKADDKQDKPQRPSKRRRSRRKPHGQGGQNKPRQAGGKPEGGQKNSAGPQSDQQGQKGPGDKNRPKRRRRPRGGQKKKTE